MADTEKSTPESKDWTVKRVGTVTFSITKPKRSARKIRQMRLKNKARSR